MRSEMRLRGRELVLDDELESFAVGTRIMQVCVMMLLNALRLCLIPYYVDYVCIYL